MKTAYITLVEMDCYSCGITFAVPETWNNKRLEDGKSFWCPNGHQQHYTKTEVQILRERLEMERKNAEFWRQQKAAIERSASALRGQATKLRKRLANGVCPCCKRSFPDLHRHMTTKHPEYAESEPQS